MDTLHTQKMKGCVCDFAQLPILLPPEAEHFLVFHFLNIPILCDVRSRKLIIHCVIFHIITALHLDCQNQIDALYISEICGGSE